MGLVLGPVVKELVSNKGDLENTINVLSCLANSSRLNVLLAIYTNDAIGRISVAETLIKGIPNVTDLVGLRKCTNKLISCGLIEKGIDKKYRPYHVTELGRASVGFLLAISQCETTMSGTTGDLRQILEEFDPETES